MTPHSDDKLRFYLGDGIVFDIRLDLFPKYYLWFVEKE